MKHVPVRDVARLPTWSFGAKAPLWWGTLSYMLIEALGFVLAIAMYFYLASLDAMWPYDRPPALGWASGLTLLFLLSELPNIWTRNAAKKFDVPRIRVGLVVMSLIGVAAIALRWYEFTTLHTRWDSNAYGSVVWLLLGLHTTHLVTDVAETIVMAVQAFVSPMDARRCSDVEDNQNYWDFVILAWLPIYFILYWFPRWVGS